MTVTYEGLNCLTDQDLAQYMQYGTDSQTAIPWASQTKYGKYTVYFGVATIFVALLKHFWFRLCDRRYAAGFRTTGLSSSLVYVVTSYCRYFGYQQTPNLLVKVFSFPRSVGNLLYSAFASGYLLCYCLVPHFWYRACAGFGSPPLAVRAGIMSTALTPFIFVLAGKSNLISIMTGIGYEKLNWIHQFLGVASLVLAIIHAVPFIYQALAEGGLSNLAAAFTDFTYLNGIPPMVLLILLCSMFRREVRAFMYELSFHAHWMIACGYFGTLMYHVYQLLDMQDYMWGTLAFWMAQLLFRFCTSGMTRSRAGEIKKLPGGTFEVVIHDLHGLKWSPGQHCFLRFPGVRVFDNHPFSIASVTSQEELKFVIVPKKGLTKKLYDQLDTEVVKKRVMVDGPYGGTSRSVTGFDNVFLCATGSGVTVTLPYLTAIATDPKNTQIAHFVWIVRNADSISWIHKELERAIEAGEGRINVDIYCVDSSDEKVAVEIPGTRLHFGKPNVKSLMRGFQPELSQRNLIVSSGSESMMRAVSQVSAEFQKCVLNDSPTSRYVEEVCLHSETFGW